MSNNKRTCEVATHFNKTPHDLSDFKFIGIEQIVNDSDSNTIEKRLLTREAYWSSAQLYILKPYGLNKRCEFRSKNRINFIASLHILNHHPQTVCQVELSFLCCRILEDQSKPLWHNYGLCARLLAHSRFIVLINF